MENKFKYLILLFLIAALLLPNFASADVLGIFDYAEEALDALEELTGVPMTFWVRIFLYYVIALIVFVTTGSLLNWIIRAPLEHPELITLHNDFVQKGWAFVAGLVNMSIILILLLIAFAYILKIETFQARKTFIRLIIIALLLNFSLVFVRALFDISNIFYNSILNVVGKDIVSDAFNVLFQGVWGFVLTMAGSILLAASSLLIPLAGPFVQFGILATWLISGYLFLPTMILQILIAFLFSFIFLLFFILFTFRIFVIWILAVLSPLAFVCYILPQTKKYWDEWLKYLLEWMLVGIFALFFLGLGLKLMPSFPQPTALWGGFILVPGWFYYYFFLFIYLVLVVWLIRKFMPTFAQLLINQTKIAGGAIWARGIKPLAKATQKEFRRAIGESERVQRWAQRQAMAERRYGIFPARVRRAVGRALGPALIEAERRDIDEIEKKVSGQRIEAQLAAYRAARTDKERIGILNAMIKDKNIDDAMDVRRFGTSAITRAEIERLYTIAQDTYNKHQLMRATFPEIARTYLPPGVPPTPPPPGITPEQHRAQYVFDRIRPADYENMSRTVLSDNEFLEAMIRRGTDRHIHRFIDRFQMDGAIAFERRLGELAAAARMTPRDFLRNVNPRMYRYFTRGAGQGLIHI